MEWDLKRAVGESGWSENDTDSGARGGKCVNGGIQCENDVKESQKEAQIDQVSTLSRRSTCQLGAHCYVAALSHDAPKDALSVLQLPDTILQELSLSLRVGGL